MDIQRGDSTYFQETLQSADFHQHVDFATHSKGHTLDLIITNNDENMISGLFPHFDLPSDHAGIICNLDMPRPPRVQVQK